MSLKNSQAGSRGILTSATDLSTTTMQQLSGTFHFWNKDEYTGMFALWKDKQKIVRQGKGVYKTGDCHVYDGTWENDLLNGPGNITINNKLVFSGDFKDMLIEGHGKHFFRHNVQIDGEFHANKLIGKAYLTDTNGKIWKGTMAKNGTSVSFRQTNHFWQSVLTMSSGDNALYYEDYEEEHYKDWETFY